MHLAQYVEIELTRLRAAAETFRVLMDEHHHESGPYQALKGHLADANEHAKSLEGVQLKLSRAELACRDYRAAPSNATYQKVLASYETLLVRQEHPLVARHLERQPAPAPRSGCRACAHTLLTTLERQLGKQINAE